MIILRPGQQEAAAYRSGYLAVPAVPGAGKTTVLAYLGAQLIAEGRTGKGKLLIVTYMNSSAANFKARLARELETRGLPGGRGYEVKTLHSLALTILKESPERLLISGEMTILEQAEQFQLLREVTHRWISGNRNVWEAALETGKQENKEKYLEKWQAKTLDFFKNMISYFKCLGLTAEEMQGYLPALADESPLRWAIEAYNQYRDRLFHLGVQDFDDLIYNARTLLKTDTAVLKRLQKRWSYIFEDEAQDSNLLQEQILLLLAGGSPEDKKGITFTGNLVRVGDSNQSVMGTFTAADPALFRSFCRSREIKNQPLLYSSRSSQNIIDLANHLVSWVATEHPVQACRQALEKQYIKPVPAADPCPNPQPERYTIGSIKSKTNREEISKIAGHASRYIRENKEKTVAILAPDKYILLEAAEQLTLLNAPFRQIAGGQSERRHTARALGAVIEYLAEPHKGSKLVKALSSTLLPELAGEDFPYIKEFLAACRLEELLYPEGAGKQELPEEAATSLLWPSCLAALKRVKTWLTASRIPPESLLLFLAADLGLENEELAIAQRIALQIKELLRSNPAWRLADLAAELQSLESIFDHFTDMVYDRHGYTPEPGVISLATYHKAKGLEWDTVFLTSLTSDSFPSQPDDYFRDHPGYLNKHMANPGALAKAELKALIEPGKIIDPQEEAKKETISERLRLLYVGITRARENLLFSYPEMLYLPGFPKPFKKKPALALQELKRYMRQKKDEFYSEKQ
ncbi:UvrD/REP helicase [Desulfofarcimen acetoxidans DSM 771]|uniref:DNA 3'-5' helicase n=1 Tax=Desulfofarcimen acetoxidans (strain ATCC 49208 / DSM 771 / KCTC 5769 / VKM B-1644 / 5575) TaxID=485916 RepID=C8VY12_DESAS|nr:ATP-dependent helicase [Desulfofarcimen acetoxidans]ACV64641.1 UvrD/REP helicase [Desulfofarcimen acetoxidans DSM 771]